MSPGDFLSVEVEAGPAHEDGLSMRFKRAGALRPVHTVAYENDDGLDGPWQVWSVDDADGAQRHEARCALVDDSSDGLSLLVIGGRHGLVLHHPTGATERAAYLLLAAHTAVT